MLDDLVVCALQTRVCALLRGTSVWDGEHQPGWDSCKTRQLPNINQVEDVRSDHVSCGLQWAGQLGDGRVINLGEVVTDKGQRWEMQLKVLE